MPNLHRLIRDVSVYESYLKGNRSYTFKKRISVTENLLEFASSLSCFKVEDFMRAQCIAAAPV
jgi:hypothetical protein